jgi:hypothetical protein
MNKTKLSGPVFPTEVWDAKGFPRQAEGMYLRDYFAAKAMQEMVGQYDFTFFEDDKREKEGDTFALVVAKNAYAMADAMLKAREA